MKNDNNKNITIIILIIVILLLLYLLIQNFGIINNNGPKVPTGNVDIFEIDCICGTCKNDKNTKKDNKNNNNESTKSTENTENNESVFKSDNDINKNKPTNEDLIVFDNYKIWDRKELRIFSNPAFEYKNIIAPGSENSYAFVIRNNNNFNVIVDISFEEVNDKNINMQYKLKHKGNYLIGSNNKYETINNKKIKNIKLPSKSQKSYILDWKWIDKDNDTEIGLDASTYYKLSIMIGANQK